MKVQSTVSTFKKKLTHVLVMLCLAVLPAISFAGPGGPGNAGNPDEVVPFDPNMNLAFLAAGLVFAVVMVVRQMNKRTAATKH